MPPRPQVAALLSLAMPGAGQWVNGERVKAATLWAMVVGVFISAWFALAGPAAVRSKIGAALLAVIYLFLWVPAVIDAYDVAAGRRHQSLLSGTRRWYVIVMLMTTGPTALPFLWQSAAFSRRAKWAWTAGVLVTAAVSVWVLLIIGPMIERTLGTLRTSLP